jgi:hypothetical protein
MTVQDGTATRRLGGWIASHHLSTWLLICVLVMIALIVRPQITNFVVFVFVSASLFLIRNLARFEGASGAVVPMRRSTLIALAVILVILAFAVFGVRYIAI